MCFGPPCRRGRINRVPIGTDTEVRATGSDQIFLTGASGFIGSHVLGALLDAGYSVKALVRPGSSIPVHKRVTPVTGDLTRSGELVAHMRGCRYIVHVAALYTFDPGMKRSVLETNVGGTGGLLEAGRIAGVERAIVTSSSATVGPMVDERWRTEEDWADSHHAGGYHGSKLAQERVALASQLPTVLVLPTAPVGPGDWKPTPTGKMIVDFMRGRIFGSLPGGLNIVPVEDVGKAHLLALEKGRDRERYLVGGENLSLRELWEILGEVTRRPAPKREVPYAAASAFSRFDTIFSRARGKEPLAPLEGVRMGREKMFVSSDKAQTELGYEPTPVREALQRAVTWYSENGYA